MFHYKNWHGDRNSKAISVGDFVRSRYRRKWYGEVTRLEPNGGTATVKVLYSHRGAPISDKNYIKQLHVSWLNVITRPVWAEGQ
mgnify:CR=1 FL=1